MARPMAEQTSFSPLYAPVMRPYTTDGMKRTRAMITMIPSISGELPRSVPSSARRNELDGRAMAMMATTRARSVKPAYLSAFRSTSLTLYSAMPFSSFSPWYSPKRGAMIFSVTMVPMKVMTKVETAMKYQLPVGSTT